MHAHEALKAAQQPGSTVGVSLGIVLV